MRAVPRGAAGPENLPVPGQEVSPTCQGLRPRGTGRALAITRPTVLPSVTETTSASRNKRLSRLNTWPIGAPVNASPRTSRWEAHELGADVVRSTFHREGLAPSPLAGLPAHLCDLWPSATSALKRGVGQQWSLTGGDTIRAVMASKPRHRPRHVHRPKRRVSRAPDQPDPRNVLPRRLNRASRRERMTLICPDGGCDTMLRVRLSLRPRQHVRYRARRMRIEQRGRQFHHLPGLGPHHEPAHRPPGKRFAQHGAIGGHLAQVQHRRVRVASPAAGGWSCSRPAARDRPAPPAGRPARRPPCRRSRPVSGTSARLAGPNSGASSGCARIASTSSASSAAAAAAQAGPGAGEPGARGGGALRGRQRRQVLQQRVQQLAATEAVAAAGALGQRRGARRAPGRARRPPAGWAPAAAGAPVPPAAARRASPARHRPTGGGGDAWGHRWRPSPPAAVRPARWHGAAPRPTSRANGGPNGSAWVGPGARSRARPGCTSTSPAWSAPVCQPQTTSRSSARVSAT